MTPSGNLPEPVAMKAVIDSLNAASLIDIALANRKDLKAAQQNIVAATAALKGAEDSVSPALDLQWQRCRVFLPRRLTSDRKRPVTHMGETEMGIKRFVPTPTMAVALAVYVNG